MIYGTLYLTMVVSVLDLDVISGYIIVDTLTVLPLEFK
jgi:hypothetical protein